MQLRTDSRGEVVPRALCGEKSRFEKFKLMQEQEALRVQKRKTSITNKSYNKNDTMKKSLYSNQLNSSNQFQNSSGLKSINEMDRGLESARPKMSVGFADQLISPQPDQSASTTLASSATVVPRL